METPLKRQPTSSQIKIADLWNVKKVDLFREEGRSTSKKESNQNFAFTSIACGTETQIIFVSDFQYKKLVFREKSIKRGAA